MVDIPALLEQCNIVEYISQYVELEEKQSGEYWGNCCFHNEDTPSLNVSSNKNLFYCFGCSKGGDLITFIVEYHKVTMPRAIEMLVEYCGGVCPQLSPISNLSSIYKKYGKKTKKTTNDKRIYLPDDVMCKYEKRLIQEWLDEGISQEALDKYQVRYDVVSNSICFPIFDNNGRIISVSHRTLDKECKSKGISKYIYSNSIGTTDFLYGFYQNKEEIYRLNEVLITEGAKGVYKLEDYGYKNCMASLTDNLSSSQIEEIIKMPIKNIVISWDEDVKLKDIKKRVGILLQFKNVYAIIDKQGILQDKMSPCDMGKDVFDKLYDNKIRI